MANNKEEAGKGTPRPGDLPGGKRTYATIDLTASEVAGRDKPPPAAGAAASASAAAETKSEGKPEAKSDAKSDAKLDTKPPGPPPKSAGPARPEPEGGASIAGGLASLGARVNSAPWLLHLASGVAGAIVVLVAAQLMTTERQPAQSQEVDALTRRVADLEGALGTRPGAGLRARVEEMARSIGALGETQAKLARETKAIDAKVDTTPEFPPELMARLAKLEGALGTVTAADPAAQSPQGVVLSGKLAELEKAARNATDLARSGIARFDGELATLRADAGRLAQRLDTLKGEVEERLQGAAKTADLASFATGLASLEREVQTFLKSEAERTANANVNATQMLLALELANLKRAIDRGESYAEELARAKKLGGFTLNFTALERYMNEGAAAPQELAKSFRKVADAMLDAEAEPAGATLMDRLLSGARSIVRVRKAGHAADDASLEAIIGRMEAAIKDGRLAEVLANAKKLPPKAALAGEDWIKKVEARQAVEQAMAEVEVQLKASIGGPQSTPKSAAPEGKR
jgi:hypothetical protein